jgi:hypothetical protein
MQTHLEVFPGVTLPMLDGTGAGGQAHPEIQIQKTGIQFPELPAQIILRIRKVNVYGSELKKGARLRSFF